MNKNKWDVFRFWFHSTRLRRNFILFYWTNFIIFHEDDWFGWIGIDAFSSESGPVYWSNPFILFFLIGYLFLGSELFVLSRIMVNTFAHHFWPWFEENRFDGFPTEISVVEAGIFSLISVSVTFFNWVQASKGILSGSKI